MNTRHASLRCRQRGIEPLALELLERFGTEMHDGRGAIVRYIDKAGRQRMEREFGHRAAARLNDMTNTYAVVASDGAVVTAGHRIRRIRRI